MSAFRVEEFPDPEDANGVPLSLAVADEEWVVVRTSPERARALQFALLDLRPLPATSRGAALGRALPRGSATERRELRQTVGVLLQPDGLIGAWSLRENLALPLAARGVAAATAASRLSRALDSFGLQGWAERRPAELPADVRQCAALARATITDPTTMLLDDPLASVASRRADAILAELRVRVPTALILVHRRADAFYARADRVGTWDARGWLPSGTGNSGSAAGAGSAA
jgi:ABC-type transporter Mla maintaining outer membrane lipid asymmetry ATPase subunit MlaF